MFRLGAGGRLLDGLQGMQTPCNVAGSHLATRSALTVLVSVAGRLVLKLSCAPGYDHEGAAHVLPGRSPAMRWATGPGSGCQRCTGSCPARPAGPTWPRCRRLDTWDRAPEGRAGQAGGSPAELQLEGRSGQHDLSGRHLWDFKNWSTFKWRSVARVLHRTYCATITVRNRQPNTWHKLPEPVVRLASLNEALVVSLVTCGGAIDWPSARLSRANQGAPELVSIENELNESNAM